MYQKLVLSPNFVKLHTTVCIRIVADLVIFSFQIKRMFKHATIVQFINISAIIFIHCWQIVIILDKIQYSFKQPK